MTQYREQKKWRQHHDDLLRTIINPGIFSYTNIATGKPAKMTVLLFPQLKRLNIERKALRLITGKHDSVLLKVWSGTMGMVTLPDHLIHPDQTIKELIIKTLAQKREARIPSYLLVVANDLIKNDAGEIDSISRYYTYCFSLKQKKEIGDVINPDFIGDDINFFNKTIMKFLVENRSVD